jgi:Leucine-rich repeat (LRR) protein
MYSKTSSEAIARCDACRNDQQEALDLSSFGIAETPAGLQSLSAHLLTLSLASNNLSDLPSTVASLSRLSSLDISSNKLTGTLSRCSPLLLRTAQLQRSVRSHIIRRS